MQSSPFSFFFSFSVSLAFSAFNRPIKRMAKKNIPCATEKSSTSVVTSWRQFNLCACMYTRTETRLLVSLPRFVHVQVQTRRKEKENQFLLRSIRQSNCFRVKFKCKKKTKSLMMMMILFIQWFENKRVSV